MAQERERPGGSEPKAAATVILLREPSAGGVEVFLVQRPSTMGFMGGMHVFPGGKVAATDARAQMQACLRDGDAGSQQAWGPDVDADAAIARAVAAIRETFEEAGVLLSPDAARLDLPAMRARLLAGEDFATLLSEQRAQLQLARLQPLSRWITPAAEPVRFDTSFYLAAVGADEHAVHDERESVASLWISPAAALAAATDQRIRLAPPTARTLEGLARADSVDAALRGTAGRTPPIIQPVIRAVGDEVMIFYPGDPEHPSPERVLEGPTRHVMRRLR